MVSVVLWKSMLQRGFKRLQLPLNSGLDKFQTYRQVVFRGYRNLETCSIRVQIVTRCLEPTKIQFNMMANILLRATLGGFLRFALFKLLEFPVDLLEAPALPEGRVEEWSQVEAIIVGSSITSQRRNMSQIGPVPTVIIAVEGRREGSHLVAWRSVSFNSQISGLVTLYREHLI